MTTTTEKLERALRRATEALEELQGGCTDSDDGTVEAITVWCPEVIDEAREALAAHEADKQPVEDERGAFEAWVEREAGPGADQDNRVGWVACLNWQAGRTSAQPVEDQAAHDNAILERGIQIGMLRAREIDGASAQAVPADQRTDVERAMDAYNGWCNRQGIHCNRLPAWSELDAKNKAEWMKKTAAAPKGD
jgi:hypothetical protein